MFIDWVKSTLLSLIDSNSRIIQCLWESNILFTIYYVYDHKSLFVSAVFNWLNHKKSQDDNDSELKEKVFF